MTPVVCEKPSVRTCGDLPPMAQMAITLMGEGEVFYKLDEDRPLFDDINRLANIAKKGMILQAVKRVLDKLD